jgi:membrane dipeptidase
MRNKLSRRTLLQGAAVSAAMVNFGIYHAVAAPAKTYSARTMALMERTLVIDMLGVVRLNLTSEAWRAPLTDEEIRKLRQSGLTAVHRAQGLGGPDAHVAALNYFAAWNGFVARNSDHFLLVDRAGDIDRAKVQKKIAFIGGIQNAEHFRTPEDVKHFHGLGQRCAQLTYNSQNLIGSGSTERVDGGISDFGEAIIRKMNEVGMLVDVSHCGDRTTLDAIEISTRPISITHSNCRALNDHPRLKSDEAIKKLAARGGVMGITGVRNFVRDREPTTIEHMVDHIDHVVKLVGVEHVGIGTDSDLDGADDMPADMLQRARSAYKSNYAFRDKMDTDGFDDAMRFYDLTEALVRRGYSDRNIEAVLGGNFRRLLASVWTGAQL